MLDGSEAAARITTVEIPSTGRYKPLYNPGGPGNDPAPGMLYSAPGPVYEHVIMAPNNPMTVTCVRSGHAGSRADRGRRRRRRPRAAAAANRELLR